MRSRSRSRSRSSSIFCLLDLLYRSVPETANATNTATIIPITIGEKNPDEEVEVGEKVGKTLLLPLPLPLLLLFPFPLLLPDVEVLEDDVAVGAAVAVPPPVTTKGTLTSTPELS
jgi:hypothetical protein